jgi:hypothetical protein
MRIIGGTEAVEDRHPYAVSLQDESWQFLWVMRIRGVVAG